jgi:hypothetical protein
MTMLNRNLNTTLVLATLVAAILSGCAATGDVSLDANGSSGAYEQDDILKKMEADSRAG